MAVLQFYRKLCSLVLRFVFSTSLVLPCSVHFVYIRHSNIVFVIKDIIHRELGMTGSFFRLYACSTLVALFFAAFL